MPQQQLRSPSTAELSSVRDESSGCSESFSQQLATSRTLACSCWAGDLSPSAEDICCRDDDCDAVWGSKVARFMTINGCEGAGVELLLRPDLNFVVLTGQWQHLSDLFKGDKLQCTASRTPATPQLEPSTLHSGHAPTPPPHICRSAPFSARLPCWTACGRGCVVHPAGGCQRW